MERNLVLIGWGRPEYPAAGAAALDGLSGHADVFGTSRAKLSQALNDRAMNYAATYVIGVGITKNFAEIIEALKKLRDAGRKVYWLSRLELEDAEPVLREEFGSSLGFTEVFIRTQDKNLAGVVGNYFKNENVQKYYRFCTPVAKKDGKSDTNVVAVFQRLFDAAWYYHSEIHDDYLYGKVVKKLWETQKLETLKEDKLLMNQLEFYDRYGDDKIVGDHPSTKALIKRIDRVAPHDSANVLILGETGTGKELIAKQIHRKSPRVNGTLVFGNCACMTGDTVLSIIFGHEKGAYTGADEMYRGLIEQADGGTLFLDEIGELNNEAQAMLLRVLDSHKLTRLGGDISKPIDVDFRLVAATNRDLVQRIAEKRFREDLFMRLSGVVLKTTPLRERGDDVIKIARYRWPKIVRRPDARFTKEQEAALMAYDFPGNVRELNNLLERANALGEEDFGALIAEQSDMMAALSRARGGGAAVTAERSETAEGRGGAPTLPVCDGVGTAFHRRPPDEDLPENIDKLLHLHAKRVYAAHGENLSESAKAAGVSVNTFKKYLGK